MTDPTLALLNELQSIDDREDHILDVLLRHGAALEESQRRMNMVTIADLRTLRDGLASLEGIIDALQADVAHAEAAAMPTLPPSAAANGSAGNGSAGNGSAVSGSAGSGHDAQPAGQSSTAATPPAAPPTATTPSAAPPPPAPAAAALPSMSFEQLATLIHEQDAQAAQSREILRDRLLALGATPVGSTNPAADGLGAAPPLVSPVGPVASVVSGPVAPDASSHRTFRLANPPMTGSDVKRLQRDLNRRFAAWKIDIHVAEDGRYGTATRHAARQALLGLGVSAEDYRHGITPQLRVLLRTPSKRTALQLAQAEARAPWRQRLREREARVSPDRQHKTSLPQTGHSAPRGGGTAAAIRAHGGRYEQDIVREAQRHGLPVSLVCAVIECETGFRNVFGHDAVRNPIKSPAKGLLEVTQARYEQYLKHRNAGAGAQGVGVMQLTSPSLQDRADAVGGCWKPGANIRIGCEFLAGNVKRLGSTRHGVRAYNGSGDAAERYATRVLERARVWHSRLTDAKSTAPLHAKPTAPTHAKPKRGPAGARGAPRTFKLKRPAMSGGDVKRLQRDLNARLERWKINSHVSEDGEYGPATRHAAQQVLLGLGIAPADYAHGITPQLRSKIRNPSLRTAAEVGRARTRESYLAKLRKRMNARGGGALRLRAYAEARRMFDLNIRESGGNNRGRLVTQIIRANGGGGPEPWCGDFMAWCYRKAGSKGVARGWASVWGIGSLAGVKRTKSPLKGNLVRFDVPGGHGHIGMFVCWCDAGGREVAGGGATHLKTIEGNTSASGAIMLRDGGRGGDGVYTKIRPRGLVHDFLQIMR